MRAHCCGLLVALVLGGVPVALHAQSGAGPNAVAEHVAAARKAAGQEHAPLFTRLCSQAAPSLVSPPPAAPAAAPAQGPPPRAAWGAEPAKVFDNLYYVGEREYSAWAVTTSDGIIIVDAIFDYSIEEQVFGGLRKLGLDPATIRYVVISHGHRDHVGGARFLQDRGARVVLSEADWDLLERTTAAWPKPKRDIVATDGYRLTLGDTTLTLHLTPGHTLGTISTLIPLKDGTRTHTAAYWGGTAFNWLGNRAGYITPERPDRFWFESYIGSARRFRDLATTAGADVLLSNHTNYDGSKTKIPALAARRADQPHPYVIGMPGVQGYLTVAEECAQAGLANLPR